MSDSRIEKLRQCAIDHNCEEGKTGFCSRHHCRLVVECENCNWRGETRTAIHTHHGYHINDEGDVDVEPVDKCPKCGSGNLIPIEEEKEPVYA